ncbi:hypothetical protein V5O48_014628 [Marasmius crinis-equi]|uniref:AAA-ATPase-like domain-containing protein n=1 Tax=Marasmius crinis-equi TaxID=585013 RepID=A0ABR3EWV2_9AGAR
MSSSRPLQKQVGESEIAKHEDQNILKHPVLSIDKKEECLEWTIIHSGYTSETLLEEANLLRDDVKNFSKVREQIPFVDHSYILEFLQARSCVLLIAPPGFGKTSIISMLEYFFDVHHKDEFDHVFRALEAKNYADTFFNPCHPDMGGHSNCYVLNLDFGDVFVDSSHHDVNSGLNKILNAFANKYELDIAQYDFTNGDVVETLKTIFSNVTGTEYGVAVFIDNYDSPYLRAIRSGLPTNKRRDLQRTISRILDVILSFHVHGSVDRIFLTGEDFVPELMTKRVQKCTYNLLNHYPTLRNVIGFSYSDALKIASRFQQEFRGLQTVEMVKEWFESEEAGDEYDEVDDLISCRRIVQLFAQHLESHAERLRDDGPVESWTEVVCY